MKPAPIYAAADAFKDFIAKADELKLQHRGGLTDRRCEGINAILQQHGREGWQKALAELGHSKFLRGEIPFTRFEEHGGVSINWLIEPRNFAKVIAGQYRDRDAPKRRRPVAMFGGIRIYEDE